MPFKTKEDYKKYQRGYYITHRKQRIRDAQNHRKSKAGTDAGLIASIENPRAYIAAMLEKICGIMGCTLEPHLREDCIQEGLEAMLRARFETSERRMLARVSNAMRRYLNKERKNP